MGSSIYTRGGDKGTTCLLDGSRVSKAALRVETYGTIDEVNSWVGAARAFVEDELLNEILEFVEHRFYNCSSNLATPPETSIDPISVSQDDIEVIERSIDRLEEVSGAISGFVLPGGSPSGGLLHVARTVCRRAERLMCSLAESEKVDPQVLAFINRSSDLLFAAARYANKKEQGGDTLWNRDFPPPRL